MINKPKSTSLEAQISDQAAIVGQQLLKRGQRLVIVESCTGGGISFALTSIAGSSQWFERGLVTYSNLAKHELAGVPMALIDKYGAVSEQVAKAMAEGGLDITQSTISLSVTGVAGPDGGSAEKPVGTVCFGLLTQQKSVTQTVVFDGDRDGIRKKSIIHALEMIVLSL